MLHDIGRLILCKYFPQAAGAALADSVRQQRPLAESERELLGVSHTQIGKKLLKKWKLPYTLEHNVHYHHHPSASPQPQQAAAVMMADIIVHGLGVGNSGEHMIAVFDDAAWQILKLPEAVFKPLIEQALGQLENLRQVLKRE